MKKNKEDIICILKSKEFGVKGNIKLNDKIRNLPEWDSLKHLTFLLAVEKKFKITLPPKKITSLITIKDFVSFINKNDNPRN